MPETACLHIQTSASATVRVVDLPGGSIRIGRAAYCEVRLNDSSLADEECRLRLRRGSWQVAPTATGGHVTIDGEPVRIPRTLAIDDGFTIGEFTLTLRRAMGVDAFRAEPGAVHEPPAVGSVDRAEWSARAEEQARRLQAQRETKRWERRWKAAGEKIRASSESRASRPPARPHSPPLPPSPIATERPRPAGFSATPLPERPRLVPIPRRPVARPFAPPAALPPEWREAPIAEEVRVVPLQLPIHSLAAPLRYAESEDFARQVEAIDGSLGAEEDLGIPPQPPDRALELADVALDDEVEEAKTSMILGSAHREEELLVEIIDAEAVAANAEIIEVEFCEVEPVQEPADPEDTPFEEPPDLARVPQVVLTPCVDAEAAPAQVEDYPRHPAVDDEPGEESERVRGVAQAPKAEAGSRDAEELPSIPEPAAFESTPRGSREWPTVRDILASQGVRAEPRGGRVRASSAQAAQVETPRRKPTYRPDPTEPRAPGTWSLPLGLAGPPAVASALFLSAMGLLAGWTWAVDGYDALVVARRLADPSALREPLPKGVSAPAGGWWSTSASSLVNWAMYDDRIAGDDPALAEDARKLLALAGNASPLHATVLHAKAQPPEGPPEPARVLGQTRDVMPLAEAGRLLLASGKKAEALNAYAQALAMASLPNRSRRIPLVFLDDPETVRYGLPGEDQIGPIVRELVSQKDWTYADWSSAVPTRAVPSVVVARVLRERGGPDFQAALALALAQAEAPPAGGESAAESAVRLAAHAEALALRKRWSDARDAYRQAVALTPADNLRRAWWLNLAAIALRLNEESDRQKALEAAKNPDPNDEITQRVVEIQKKAGYSAQRSLARGAAAIAGKNPSAN